MGNETFYWDGHTGASDKMQKEQRYEKYFNMYSFEDFVGSLSSSLEKNLSRVLTRTGSRLTCTVLVFFISFNFNLDRVTLIRSVTSIVFNQTNKEHH